MKSRKVAILLGVVAMLVLVAGAAYAAGITTRIDVVLNSINLRVSGQAVQADNILYNGTTYVPLRAVAQMLGKTVGFDSATNTASINDSVPVGEPEPPTEPDEPQSPPVTDDNEYIVTDSNGKALYSVRIISITAMEERNEFSDKTPTQVLLMEYEYTNIASEEEVWVGDSDFKVIDAGGRIGYSYPNSKTHYAQHLPQGVTCTAQAIYGIDNASETVKVNFYPEYEETAAATFIIAVE